MMRLTRQSEIAISILALCARPGTNLPVTTHMAAGHAGTTKDHAAQIVGKLVRTGYLASERGRAGGIRLARIAGRINLGEVLRLMEGSLDNGSSGGSGGGNPAEAFGALQRAALDSFLAIFDDFTIADLIGDPASSRIACLGCDLHMLFRRRGTRLPLQQPVTKAALRRRTANPMAAIPA